MQLYTTHIKTHILIYLFLKNLVKMERTFKRQNSLNIVLEEDAH